MDLYSTLSKAGGDGVVVKWQETETVPTTCNLVSNKKENLSTATFKVPADYSMVNASKFSKK